MLTRTANRTLLLFGFTLLLLLPAGSMPLMESTEARYAEIAREMIVSGNYLEPHFNAIKHFHKPPLAYWLTVAGFKIFGLNNFGARFFCVLAAVLAVFYLYRTACMLLRNEKQALLASYIFSSSLLFLVVSRLASTEIYLVTCVVAAQFYLLRQAFGTRGWHNALFYGVFLGLGFAVKGPIIFLFTLLPGLVAKLFDSHHRHLFSWREVAIASTAFSLIALPWYLIVVIKNPGLLEYFLKVQTVDRVITDRFQRYEPPWYFFYIFAVTFFPYTLFLLKGLWNWKKLSEQLKPLLLYIALPMLVFSLVKGKHATYILPFYGSCAILTAGMLARDSMPRLRNLITWLLLLLALAPAIAGFIYPPLRGVSAWLVLAGLVAFILWWQIWSVRRRESYWGWIVVLMVFLSGIGIWGAGIAGPQMRGYQQMAAELNRRDPEQRMETLVFRGYLPSLSFYRNHLAVMALSRKREIQFQPEISYRPWYLSNNKELKAFLTDHPELFVVTRKKTLELFSETYSYQCEPAFIQRKYSAYLCKSIPEPEGENPLQSK
ncbi:MAG: glycosyltransferase family 39 protein [Deltaproteobacteria bacterium]|nr:MAG: glycosyltransferase family 39 protein [Deltaproteobacteria bacterium]